MIFSLNAHIYGCMEHYYKFIQGWFDDTRTFDKAVDWFNTGRFVEIGAWKGRSTAYLGTAIINSGKNIKLDVVDTFCGSEEHLDVNQEKLYEEFCFNIGPIRSAIGTVHIMKSVDAAKKYRDNSLDFVFIDASHDYDNVMADLKSWYPKVREGGMIGGDDYTDSWPGVKRAVDEFFSTLYSTSENKYNFVVSTFGPHWHMTK